MTQCMVDKYAHDRRFCISLYSQVLANKLRVALLYIYKDQCYIL